MSATRWPSKRRAIVGLVVLTLAVVLLWQWMSAKAGNEVAPRADAASLSPLGISFKRASVSPVPSGSVPQQTSVSEARRPEFAEKPPDSTAKEASSGHPTTPSDTDEEGWRKEYQRLLEKKIARWEHRIRPACDGVPEVEAALADAVAVSQEIAFSAAAARVGKTDREENAQYEKQALTNHNKRVCKAVRASRASEACLHKFRMCDAIEQGMEWVP